MEPCSAEEFRAICAELVAKYPPPKGCKVQFRRVPKADIDGIQGETGKEGRTFSITVMTEASLALTEDIVLHEYAHAMCWRPFHPLQSDHDGVWGCVFADVYRAYYGVT